MLWRVLSLLFIAATLAETTAHTTTRCFDCSNVRHPVDCKTVRQCPIGQQCKVTEFVTSTGALLYNSSCETRQKCSFDKRRAVQEYRTDYQALAKRSSSDILVCAHCCEDDFCNSHGCGATELTHPGAGPLCFKCDNENDPRNCTQITQCDDGEVCMLTEVPSRIPGRANEFNSGCVGRMVCKAYALIGKKKRYTFCHRCCSDNFCNDRCENQATSTTSFTPAKVTSITSTTLLPTTTSPKVTSTAHPTPTTPSHQGHTHPGRTCHSYGYTHAKYNGSHICYKIHYDHHSWDHANAICKMEGATLAIVDTEAKWNALKNALLQAKHAQHLTHERFYIGAKDAGNEGKAFYWVSGARVAFAHWGPGEPNAGQNQHQQPCIYLNTEENFTWHDIACDKLYEFICSMPL